MTQQRDEPDQTAAASVAEWGQHWEGKDIAPIMGAALGNLSRAYLALAQQLAEARAEVAKWSSEALKQVGEERALRKAAEQSLAAKTAKCERLRREAPVPCPNCKHSSPVYICHACHKAPR
jgi:hypothetical protein